MRQPIRKLAASGTLASLLLTGLVGGCAPDRAVVVDDEYEISGTVTYRERIMLPTAARVELAVLDLAGEQLADTSFVAAQQPPISFTLRVPHARVDTARVYVLTARLSAEESHLVWATPEPVPVLTRGAPRELELVLASERRPQAPLTEPWRQARERGVSFRAVGQEPSWMLDLYGRMRSPQRLQLSLENGEQTFDFRQVIRDEDGDGNPRYRASAEDARVEAVIEDRLCRDVMSGEEFEAQVTVRLNDHLLFGCGRELS